VISRCGYEEVELRGLVGARELLSLLVWCNAADGAMKHKAAVGAAFKITDRLPTVRNS